MPMRKTEWALAAGLLLAFSPALVALADVWSRLDYYSHGFLVPVVGFWMISQQARLPAVRDGRPAAAGSVGVALALLLYGAGLAAGSPSLQGLAFVGAVAGLVWWRRGGEALRTLAFPVAFLLFMVPLPDAWVTPLIVQLQLTVSSAAVGFLHWFGFTVAQQGNVLILPGNERLFVDEACSGITSIITLTPLGVLLAYYTGHGFWRRLALVALVVPVAMLGNLTRVLATVVAANRYGAEKVTGNALHDSAGLLTFVLACVLLIGCGSLLRRGASAPRAGPA